MSETIKSPGGITVRFLEAIDCFKGKYGYWPTSLETDAETLAMIATVCLTPKGFYQLQSKINIVVSDEYRLLAKGKNNDVLDYSQEGWNIQHNNEAHDWLGFEED
jgi:hypothetical protein